MESQLYLLGGLGALFMGAMLGLFGAGGSILTVPLLVFIFLIPAKLASHYSLFIVGLVSGFGMLRDRKGSALPFSHLIWFALPAMLGMFIMRNWILPQLPGSFTFGANFQIPLDKFILFVFGLFMLAASFSMLFVKIKEKDLNAPKSKSELFLLSLTGLLIGLSTGFVGAGGGFLIVPALVFFARFSVAEATRTSLFLIMLNSLWGFFTSRSDWSLIPWMLLLYVVIVALGGMMIGQFLRNKSNPAKLKPAFGIFVLLMGSYVIWKSL